MEYSQSEVLQYVSENDVKFIKLFFTDIFGNIKSVSVQPHILRRAFADGVSFDAAAIAGYTSAAKSDLFLFPDASTLSVLPWRPQHGRVARMYCSVRYPDGTPFEADARLALKKVMEKAKLMGFDVQVGTECEFYLFRLDENGNPSKIPHDNASYCDLAPLDKGENVRREIILTLEQMGIEPETSHHEAGPGQNEIDFKYNSALKAADNFSTFKTAVKTVAAQNGLFASFMPKPIDDQAGSGLHINLSLIKNGHNLFSENSPESQAFIAGILYRIREISALLNPLEQSYKRLGSFEAPKYVSWSKENRSQLIRVPAAKGDSVRIELRSPDPSCNQYLALAAVIAAGLEGIETKRTLPPAVNLNLFTATAKELASLESLPESLEEALELFEKSSFASSVLGSDIVKAFADTRRKYPQPRFGEL